MPDINYPSHTFRSGDVSRWDTLASDLRERIETLESGRLIELGFTIQPLARLDDHRYPQ